MEIIYLEPLQLGDILHCRFACIGCKQSVPCWGTFLGLQYPPVHSSQEIPMHIEESFLLHCVYSSLQTSHVSKNKMQTNACCLLHWYMNGQYLASSILSDCKGPILFGMANLNVMWLSSGNHSWLDLIKHNPSIAFTSSSALASFWTYAPSYPQIQDSVNCNLTKKLWKQSIRVKRYTKQSNGMTVCWSPGTL